MTLNIGMQTKYRFLFKCRHINSFCISMAIVVNIKSNENDEWCRLFQAYKSDTHSYICRKNWKETHMSSVQKDIAVTIRQKFIAMTFIYCFILVGFSDVSRILQFAIALQTLPSWETELICKSKLHLLFIFSGIIGFIFIPHLNTVLQCLLQFLWGLKQVFFNF